MVDGPRSTEREQSRGEALRELSRAQRQLLAALAALESEDRREREAGAMALDHAEARVAHAMAALDRLADEGGDEEAPAGRDLSDVGRRAAPSGFEGAADAETALAPGPSGTGREPFGEAEVRQVLDELTELARRCAADVGDLRALLHATGELAGPADEAAGAAEEGDSERDALEPRRRSASRRDVLRSLAADLSQTTIEDLARSLSELDARIEAVARALPAEPVRGGEADDVADARLAAVEERLAAVERRLRWLEASARR